MANKNNIPEIEFIKGINEPVVPEIRLTRSQDGRTGRAYFKFNQPSILDSEKYKDIQGMFLKDEEGTLITRDVNIRMENGKRTGIESIYTWKSESEFNRFMKFAKRYAEANGLGYKKS